MPVASSSSSSPLMKLESESPLEGTLTAAASAFKLPGQRYPTPSPGNGDRVFYETLIEQRPDSEMAQEWCVYYGVLDASRAAALWALIQKRKGLKAGGSISPARPTPVKAARNSPAAKKAPGKKVPAKKPKDKADKKAPASKKGTKDSKEKKEKKDKKEKG